MGNDFRVRHFSRSARNNRIATDCFPPHEGGRLLAQRSRDAPLKGVALTAQGDARIRVIEPPPAHLGGASGVRCAELLGFLLDTTP